MLSAILASVSIEELVVRMVATALVVIAVAIAVGRFGPLIGGALAGLPIVLGPGFYFLIGKAPADFVAEAAAYSVLSLCATQIFILTYIATASRAAPIPSIAAATGAWLASVLLVQFLPPEPWSSGAIFIAVTLFARWAGSRFRRDVIKVRRNESPGLLILRGGLAGLLVAAVTTAASRFGAQWSGLLLAYPIGYTVISVTIHERFGRETAIATLLSTLLGTVSLAVFCAALALSVPHLPPHGAFFVALGASVAFTFSLVLRSHWQTVGR